MGDTAGVGCNQIHSAIPAWICDHCGAEQCDACVRRKAYGRTVIETCEQCGARCAPIQDPNPASSKPPMVLIVSIGVVAACVLGLVILTVVGGRALQSSAGASYLEAMERRAALNQESSNPGVRTGRKYDWKIVHKGTIKRMVYLESAGYEDICAFADILDDVLNTAMEGRTVEVLFFDDPDHTPHTNFISDSEKAHLRATYKYSQGTAVSSFAWVEAETGSRPLKLRRRRAKKPGLCTGS